MDRLEELIKELPREIQHNFVNILEFIIQKRAQRIKSAAKPEQPKPIASPSIRYGPSEKSKVIAQARAEFLKLYEQARREAGMGQKMAAGAKFIKTYKLRTWPELYAVLKHKVSLSTAARWATAIEKSGDPSDLEPKHGKHRKDKTKRTAEQERCLRESALRHPDWYKTKMVRAAQKMMAKQGIIDNCHESTYLRYLKKLSEEVV